MKSFELHISEGGGEDDADAQVTLERVSADSAETRSVVARATLWWREAPFLDGVRIGAIGGFSAADAVASKQFLDGTVNYLREQGCRIAVGPMNGNTWQGYRFVVDSESRGPYWLEPRNLPEYPIWWQDAGFSVLSRYSSSVMILDGTATLPSAVKARLERSGVIVRKLDPVCYEDELRLIHAVSLKCFTNNFLYTPLGLDDFMTGYQKIRDRLDPDLVRIAERDGVVCGFVFGIPDLEAHARGEKPAVIVKTLAVDPEARCAGLGSLLVDELHQVAREKGYQEAIHALQHETNTSLKITGRHQGKVFRRYALFSKLL